VANTPTCWCMAEPRGAPLAAYASCLCQTCLRLTRQARED
jgi:hypothetical protein